MRPPGSLAELEARRRRAAEYFQGRKPLGKIASLLGVSLTSVKRWKRTCKAEGWEGLAARPHPGPTPKLSQAQRQSLVKILLEGPVASTFRTDLWTCARVAQVVGKKFGVSYPRQHIRRILHDLGCSPQQSRRVAREQDVEAVERWRKKDWPRIKKTRRCCASIEFTFIDETGFRLQPVNRRTWAPRGQTPLQREWDRYGRLSVIGAVTLSPTRRGSGTPLQIHEDNIRTDEVVEFVRQLKKPIQRPMINCLDRWQVHRSAAKRVARSRLKGIDFEWLPAYAPELNPVEAR